MRHRRQIARLGASTVLAGTASLALALVPSRAQEIDAEPPLADLAVGERRGAGPSTPESVLFEADNVTRDNEDGPIVAEGNVIAYFGDRLVRADRLVYDPATDVVVAEGNVSITDKGLETAFAGRVFLTGDLRDGIAENFSALLAENAKLAADSAVREQGARTKLRKAVFTSCPVCDKEGDAKTPTWRIKALRVTRDQERQVVRFHHAFFEIKGTPILYSPYLQAPDPEVERQSGFLTPAIGASSRLGFNVELPYYLAISNHQDATFFPKYTSNDGILWQGEWRRRGNDGYHVLSGGVIDFDNERLDENGQIPVDVPGVRWHFFGKGYRNFGERLTAGYDIERISDDTYLRRYDVQRRGDLRQELDTASTNRLRSNAYLRWADGNTLFTADSFLFQGLRNTDEASLTPYVLPLLNLRQDLPDVFAGGDATVNVNFASLQRTGGVDSRRLTTSVAWEREVITPGGHRFNGFAEVRADAYRFEDLDEGTETLPGVAGSNNRNRGRFAPTAGVEWSYPLTRRAGGARLFVEPRVQVAVSPSNANPIGIINEDSQSIEFDYASLFDANKSTGFDAFEDGQRINAGFVASAVFDSGLKLEGEIGQQFRLQSTSAFDRSTGLGSTRSDLVGSMNLRYRDVIGVENRFRIDDGGGGIQRAESLAYLNLWRLRGNLSYVRLNEENALAELNRREELNAGVSGRLSRHWTAGTSWRQDLLANQLITQDFALTYQDDCSLFELVYRRNRTQDVGLPADNAFLIRFTLTGLVD